MGVNSLVDKTIQSNTDYTEIYYNVGSKQVEG